MVPMNSPLRDTAQRELLWLAPDGGAWTVTLPD
jgi:hypothetical protein